MYKLLLHFSNEIRPIYWEKEGRAGCGIRRSLQSWYSNGLLGFGVASSSRQLLGSQCAKLILKTMMQILVFQYKEKGLQVSVSMLLVELGLHGTGKIPNHLDVETIDEN